jgi:2-oxoglutarate dehydrogenase E1 component
VLLCSGKVFFALSAARDNETDASNKSVSRSEKITDIAIVRVEQPYPFPAKEISNVLGKYRNARQVLWVQEEPKNRGCWTFMEPRLRELLPTGSTLTYCGREEAASPATGSHKMHEIEEEELLEHALDLKNRKAAPVTAVATSLPATAAPTAVSQ